MFQQKNERIQARDNLLSLACTIAPIDGMAMV